jgi:hypothetical protein
MDQGELTSLRQKLERYRFIRRSIRDPATQQTMDVLIAETEEQLDAENVKMLEPE